MSSKALGFVDDRCVSLSGYALGTDEFFTLTPPFTSYGLGVSGVDVASSYESTTGNALAFDAQRLGFTSVVDVKTGVGLFAPQVPTYSVASPGVAHVYSTGLSNAVRATSTRYVRIGNYWESGSAGTSTNTGFLGIGSLSVGAPGAVELTHAFGCNLGLPSCPQPTSVPPQFLALHDVTLTPDERFAIVSGQRLYGVFEMATGLAKSSTGDSGTSISNSSPLPTPGFHTSPFMFLTSDSVEATNARAVIIGGGHSGVLSCPSNKHPVRWRVAIVNLRSFADVVYDDPAPLSCDGSMAQDVAITPNGQWAIMSTRRGAYRINLSPSIWPPPAPEPYNDGTDSLEVNNSLGYVSDSVVCTNTRAVVIGRHYLTGAPQVAVINPNLPVTDPMACRIVALPNGGAVMPTDVIIDPSERYAVVRSKRTNGTPLVPTSYGRVSFVELSGVPGLLSEFDHEPATGADLGSSWALDQIDSGSKYIVTAGEDERSAGDPVSRGWFQIFELP